MKIEDKVHDKVPEGKTDPTDKEAPAKAAPDKTLPGKDCPGKGKKERDNLSQGGKDGPKAPGEAPAEPPKEEPKEPPRPADQGKLVWLKLSEVHPFHTFRPQPFRVR